MKKWFYVCGTAIIAGVLAFTITFINYDVKEDIKITPIKLDSGREYIKEESSIMINPESITREKIKQVTKVNQDASNEVIKEVSAKPAKYIKPIDGILIKDYAKDNLIYSKTLNEWTVHEGIDLKAPIGSEVVAISDGAISNIYFDYMLGNVIEIKHDKGYTSIYAEIEVSPNLKVGNKVKAGEKIASIGESKGIEIEDEPHLHFEIKKDGKNISPKELIM